MSFQDLNKLDEALSRIDAKQVLVRDLRKSTPMPMSALRGTGQ